MGSELARFESTYRETYGRITAYAARRCDSPQDAADVVAATFAVAWRRTGEVPDGDQTVLWLYGVARKLPAAIAAERPGPSVARPRRRPARRLVLGPAGAGLLAAGLVVGPGLVNHGGTPSYAVTREPDRVVYVEVRDFRDKDGLAKQLEELGVPAVVDYAPPGKWCRDCRAGAAGDQAARAEGPVRDHAGRAGRSGRVRHPPYADRARRRRLGRLGGRGAAPGRGADPPARHRQALRQEPRLRGPRDNVIKE